MTSKYVLTYHGFLPATKTSARSSSQETHSRLTASERREQLIQVAVDLFSRKGFNGTTTREIAVAAGVTEAIIFRHFETKQQLYLAIIDRKINSPGSAAWITALRGHMERDDDEAVVRTLISAIVDTHRTDPKFERLMIYAALEGQEIALIYIRQLTAAIVDAFRQYFARRQKPTGKSFSPDIALAAIAGMAAHYSVSKYVYALKEACISDEDAIQDFTRIALAGLSLQDSPALEVKK